MNIVFSDTNVADGSEEDDPVFCEFPIGPGHQFSPADEVHNYAEELLKISGQKVIVSEPKIMDLFKGRCQDPSCSSQCKVRSKSVGCTQRFGGLAKMDIKGNGAYQKNMVQCTPTTCNFLLQSCFWQQLFESRDDEQISGLGLSFKGLLLSCAEV